MRKTTKVLEDVGLSELQVEEMYRYMAIANYEDRFVIPTAHREDAMNEAFAERGGCGFSFATVVLRATVKSTCLVARKPTKETSLKPFKSRNKRGIHMQILKIISALMCYPTEDLQDASAGIAAGY